MRGTDGAAQETTGRDAVEEGHKWQDNNLIFPTSKGTPLYHNWFCKKVGGASVNEEIAERAGIRRISEHSLRKTGAPILESELGVSREIAKAAHCGTKVAA